MPIMYVNAGKKGRKGLRVRGRGKVGKFTRKAKHRRASGKKRKGRMPSALAAYWAKKRGKKAGRKAKARRRRKLKTTRRKARRHKKKRNPMARRRRKSRRSRKARRTHRRRARRSHTKRRRRRKSASAPKRRRRRRKKATHRRRRRRARKTHRRRRRRARKSSRRHRRRRKKSHSRRRRRRRKSATVLMYGGAGGKTLRMNPRRRRRSRRRRGGHRRRRLSRRYRRSYRRNPGGMLIDMAKKAVPVLIGLYGSRLLVAKIGPMLPGVSALGTLQTPALAVGAWIGMNYATKKVGFLAKYRTELMMGTALAALDSLFQSFAPASVKQLVGMSDYIAVGDYVQMGATPIDDDIAMSDYIAVGGDGVQEELGLEEELGVEEELGNDLLGGVSQGSLLKTVPSRQFLEPVPARSFTKQIGAAGSSYDNAGGMYQGIFRGGW